MVIKKDNLALVGRIYRENTESRASVRKLLLSSRFRAVWWDWNRCVQETFSGNEPRFSNPMSKSGKHERSQKWLSGSSCDHCQRGE